MEPSENLKYIFDVCVFVLRRILPVEIYLFFPQSNGTAAVGRTEAIIASVAERVVGVCFFVIILQSVGLF